MPLYLGMTNKEAHDSNFVCPFKPQERIDYRLQEYKAAAVIKNKVME